MYSLDSFSSIFEISFALCIAYGFIRAAYSYPIINKRRFLDNAISVSKHDGFARSENDIDATVDMLSRHLKYVERETQGLYTKLSRVSIACSIIPLTSLIIAGFSNATFSALPISIVLLCNLMPCPTLAFLGWFKTNKLLKPQHKLYEYLGDEIMRTILAAQSNHVAQKHNKRMQTES